MDTASNLCGGLRWWGRTDRGKVRPNNEDAFLGLRFNARESQLLGRSGEAGLWDADFVFAVSDGMGGANAGEFASRMAMDRVTTLLPRSFGQAAAGIPSGPTEVLGELFDRIHTALAFVGTSYEECSGMEATLSLCWFSPQWMHFGHIGDSRIYYLRPNDARVRQLTSDDTHVGWLQRTGQINEREARRHPRRSILQKALGGSNQFVDPQVGAVAFEPGDVFLLCTDGLIDGLYDEHLTDQLRAFTDGRPTEDLAHRIVEASVENSGRDNTTALVVGVY